MVLRSHDVELDKVNTLLEKNYVCSLRFWWKFRRISIELFGHAANSNNNQIWIRKVNHKENSSLRKIKLLINFLFLLCFTQPSPKPIFSLLLPSLRCRVISNTHLIYERRARCGNFDPFTPRRAALVTVRKRAVGVGGCCFFFCATHAAASGLNGNVGLPFRRHRCRKIKRSRNVLGTNISHLTTIWRGEK